jgi:hypothetical protein
MPAAILAHSLPGHCKLAPDHLYRDTTTGKSLICSRRSSINSDSSCCREDIPSSVLRPQAPSRPYLTQWRYHLQDLLRSLTPIPMTLLRDQNQQLCSLHQGRLSSRPRLSAQMIRHCNLYRGRRETIEAARRNGQGNNRSLYQLRMGLGCQRHHNRIGRQLNRKVLREPVSTDFKGGI